MPAVISCTDCGGRGSYLVGDEQTICALCQGTGDGAHNPPFHTSDYWKTRYDRGAGSGGGSRGAEAAMKASLIDRVIDEAQPQSVLDFGCGDGYVGALVTREVPRWIAYDPNVAGLGRLPDGVFDLVLSLDVLFHLPNDEEYRAYMRSLFDYAAHYVLVWSTNHDNANGHHHVLDRAWLADVPHGWTVKWAIGETGFEKKGAWLLEKTQ